MVLYKTLFPFYFSSPRFGTGACQFHIVQRFKLVLLSKFGLWEEGRTNKRIIYGNLVFIMSTWRLDVGYVFTLFYDTVWDASCLHNANPHIQMHVPVVLIVTISLTVSNKIRSMIVIGFWISSLSLSTVHIYLFHALYVPLNWCPLHLDHIPSRYMSI